MPESRINHHTPHYLNGNGNFGLAYHLEMIRDAERVSRICAALDEILVADGVHCELGAGTGIFSIYAARQCRKVYAIEQDQEVFKLARRNIEASGLAHKIELLPIDALEFRPTEQADTLLTEMMSIWGINEPQIPVMNHALQHILKPDGRAVPQRIVNLFELGHYDFDRMGVSCAAPIPQFSGIAKPRIMTTSHFFNEFDLNVSNPRIIDQSVLVRSLLSGRINCARLSSLVQLSDQVTFFSTDTLMPQTIIPLPEVPVRAGEQLRFSAAFTTRSSLEAAVFQLEQLGK